MRTIRFGTNEKHVVLRGGTRGYVYVKINVVEIYFSSFSYPYFLLFIIFFVLAAAPLLLFSLTSF
jgi:hypothetical protein